MTGAVFIQTAPLGIGFVDEKGVRLLDAAFGRGCLKQPVEKFQRIDKAHQGMMDHLLDARFFY
jgi:hypothetical protein